MKNLKSIFFILMCFQFYFANAFILKEDSLKSEYDIKDPRNPNCPCHKFQKLADDEYRKLLGKEIKFDPNENKNNFHNSFIGRNDLNENNKTNSKKNRSKKWTHSFFSFKKKKSSKRKKVRRLRRDNTTCYHF